MNSFKYVFLTEVYCSALNYSLEIELVAEVNHYPAYKGSRECGVPMEPDEDESFEVIAITPNSLKPNNLEIEMVKLFNDIDDYSQLIDEINGSYEYGDYAA